MKRQVGSVQKCVLSALLSSAAWAIPGMQALAADQLPVKAPVAVEAIPYWWWHGEVDIGGRFFLNDPQKEWLKLSRPEQPGQILRISGPTTGSLWEHLAVNRKQRRPLSS